LDVETQFREQVIRRDHFDSTLASTICKALVTGNKGAPLELGGGSDQSVAGVINVPGLEGLDSLPVRCETSEAQAGESPRRTRRLG
jgi:hypothetical protein